MCYNSGILRKEKENKMKNEIFAIIAELETMQEKIAEIMENVTDENAEQLDDAIMQIDNAIARLHEAV